MRLLVLLPVFVSLASSIRLEQCSLARILLEENVPRSQIGDWLCLARFESGYFTHNKAKLPNGTFNYGIFGINDKLWCKSPRNHKENRCDTECSALTDANIQDDIQCALLIHSTMGFNAWKAWPRCRGRYNQRWYRECNID